MFNKISKYFIQIITFVFCVTLVSFIIFAYTIKADPNGFAFIILESSLFSIITTTLIGLFIKTMIYLSRKNITQFENLSNKLLQKLSTEASGTYHHSINVSALAQNAAVAIGANSQLVRISSYYHDIGKLNDPSSYVENQSGIEIPENEDEENIRKSAKIIIDHVKFGLKIAEENKLPKEIINLIAEHHGTTRALYFYTKAKEMGLKIKKTDFRYAGPKPQSKESAILMISDCVEATARSMSDLTNDKILKIINDTIAERISEKQFSNSVLNKKEIEIIKDSLHKTLIAIYHQRMEYKQC